MGKLTAKLALRKGEENLRDITIGHGIFGHPVPHDRSQSLSVTHCDGIGAALAYDREMLAGIDV